MSEGTGSWSREALGTLLGQAVNNVLTEIKLVRTPAHSRRLLRAMLRLSAELAVQMNVPVAVFCAVAIEAFLSEQADLAANPEYGGGGGVA